MLYSSPGSSKLIPGIDSGSVHCTEEDAADNSVPIGLDIFDGKLDFCIYLKNAILSNYAKFTEIMCGQFLAGVKVV